MQTKTYFASSVPAALELARKELGVEALLVNSKPAPAAAQLFGSLEVTFAFDPKPARHSGAERPAQALSELDEIREQLLALRLAVGRTDTSGSAVRDENLSADTLCAAGLEKDTAQEIFEAAALRPGERRNAFEEELARRIPQASFVRMKTGESRALAFVGPAGRGKTTTLVKIAVRFGLALRVPVRIYGAGAHGVGCQEQLARYAAILGVPFLACESLESLGLALTGESWRGLALIDTPGISLADTEGISELANFFSRRPEIEKHLVLRADARSADMLHAVSRLSSLAPSRLLFTGVEEALSMGAVVETLLRSRIPAVFAGTGQKIPDDIELINTAGLAHMMCGEKHGGQLASAAMAA
jgi:flagellar biosynthesis protein FlhF